MLEWIESFVFADQWLVQHGKNFVIQMQVRLHRFWRETIEGENPSDQASSDRGGKVVLSDQQTHQKMSDTLLLCGKSLKACRCAVEYIGSSCASLQGWKGNSAA